MTMLRTRPHIQNVIQWRRRNCVKNTQFVRDLMIFRSVMQSFRTLKMNNLPDGYILVAKLRFR